MIITINENIEMKCHYIIWCRIPIGAVVNRLIIWAATIANTMYEKLGLIHFKNWRPICYIQDLPSECTRMLSTKALRTSYVWRWEGCQPDRRQTSGWLVTARKPKQRGGLVESKSLWRKLYCIWASLWYWGILEVSKVGLLWNATHRKINYLEKCW